MKTAFVCPQYRFLLFGRQNTQLLVSRQKRKFLRQCDRHTASLSLQEEPSHALNIDYDEFVSDDTHVVLDSSQVSAVLDKLKANGSDTGLDLDWEEEFLSLAEEEDKKLSNVQTQLTIDTEEPQSETEQVQSEIEQVQSETEDKDFNQGTMKYFSDENISHMPRWLREMYEKGSHEELEVNAEKFCNRQRLHKVVDRKKDLDANSLSNGDGIVDCTVGDVADDYFVPIEFVVDAMLAYGVPVPISESTSIRNSMTTEEIQKLLKLITSFDHVDLSERYSDDSLAELADAYDTDVSRFIDVCEKEGLYLCRGENTRLSLVRENRVLDILFRGADMGRPYPPLLEGLD